MSISEELHPYRDRFPDLSDEEFAKLLQVEEAVAALSTYLRERVAGLGPLSGQESKFEYNANFPYPISNTAYELAHLVIDSFGSFEAIEAQADQTKS